MYANCVHPLYKKRDLVLHGKILQRIAQVTPPCVLVLSTQQSTGSCQARACGDKRFALTCCCVVAGAYIMQCKDFLWCRAVLPPDPSSICVGSGAQQPHDDISAVLLCLFTVDYVRHVVWDLLPSNYFCEHSCQRRGMRCCRPHPRLLPPPCEGVWEVLQ
jgi:hypothetical protein